MRRALGLFLVAVIFFIGFVLANLPARLVFDLAARPAGLSAGLVQGPAWDAALWRLQSGETRLAEARAQLAPASLLTGTARLDVQIIDPTVRGDGQVRVSAGGIEIRDASAVIALERFALATMLPPGESAQLSIETLRLDSQGRCENAEGRVSSAALIGLGESLGVDLPRLDGELFCAGDQLGLELQGQNARLSLQGTVRLSQRATQWTVRAETSDAQVVQALSILGFEQVGPGSFLLDSVQLDEES